MPENDDKQPIRQELAYEIENRDINDEFTVNIGDKKQVLRAGDGYYVAPNLPHGCVCLEAGILIDTFSPMREDFLK